MKYVNYFLLFLLIFVIGLRLWLKADSFSDATPSQSKLSAIEAEEYTPRPFEIKTINGVDYLVSRSEPGKFGGKLVLSTIGEGPKTFNPWESKDATSSTMSDLMFDGLLTTDVYTGDVALRLAKSIKILPDKVSYIIELRHGLKWSDGKPITADDVFFTWKEIVFKGLGNTSTKDSMTIDGQLPSIEKIDDYTVKFVTPKPFAPFLRMLSNPIAPKHKMEKIVKNGQNAFQSYLSTTSPKSEFVTSGPFMLSEYVPAQRVVFKKNPNYATIDSAGQRLPYLDSLVFMIVGDLNNELLKFEAGEIDIIDLRGANVARYKERENHSDYKIYNLGPATGTLFFTFNINKRKNSNGKYYVDLKKQHWFNDLNFRKAVDYSIDRENIVFNIANGLGSPLFTAEALSSIFLNEKIAKGHKKDIRYAKELLKKSGFSWDAKGQLYDNLGNKVEFDMLTNAGNTEREAIGVMIKQDLQELGIKVNFKPTEFNTLVNRMSNTLDWETAIMGFTGSPLEPHNGKNVINSYGTLHLFNKRDDNALKIDDREPWEKELDKIFNQAALELDFSKRKVLYDKYQETMYEQAPIIYLYSPLRITAIRKKFKNIHPTKLGGTIHNLDEVYIN